MEFDWNSIGFDWIRMDFVFRSIIQEDPTELVDFLAFGVRRRALSAWQGLPAVAPVVSDLDV